MQFLRKLDMLLIIIELKKGYEGGGQGRSWQSKSTPNIQQRKKRYF